MCSEKRRGEKTCFCFCFSWHFSSPSFSLSLSLSRRSSFSFLRLLGQAGRRSLMSLNASSLVAFRLYFRSPSTGCSLLDGRCIVPSIYWLTLSTLQRQLAKFSKGFFVIRNAVWHLVQWLVQLLLLLHWLLVRLFFSLLFFFLFFLCYWNSNVPAWMKKKRL